MRWLLASLCLWLLSFGSATPVHGAVGGAGNTSITNTTSTTSHNTYTDYTAYQTRVLGYVYSDGAAGFHEAYVFDQTTPHSPSSTEVSSLFDQAGAAVNAALQDTSILPGRCATLTQGGPELIASSQSVSESLNHTETSVTTQTTIGPATILIGEEQSQTFFVAAGTININVNTHTESFIDRTTTNSNTYQVTGHKFVSPIILDLSGTGRIQASNGVYNPHPKQFYMARRVLFDFYGNGFPVAMEWVGPSDGLLCQPKEDGSIDGTCLFGTSTGYETGFEHLASLDKNMDYKVSGQELAGLMVWQDKNGNARAEQGELTSVQELGIGELSVKNSKNVGSFMINGKQQKMFDWWPTVMQLKKVNYKPAV